MDQLSLDVQLPDQAEFSNFVAGRNRETLDALMAHCSAMTDPVFWLHGPAAVGKTHLLVAACHQVTRDGGKAAFFAASRAADLSAEDIDSWADKDFVAIDDVDALAGLAGWERALFNLFNALRDNGSVMLVSAAASPRETDFQLQDLASRMTSGLVYRIRPLTDEERIEALQVRAQKRGFELPDETSRYLIYRCPRDLSSLFAVLDKLDAASLREQRRVTVPFVKRVLGLASDNIDD